MSADLAQAGFIHRAYKLGQEHINGDALMSLACAALHRRGEPASYWRDLRRRLQSWEATHGRAPGDAAVLFDGIAGTLGADVRWESEGVTR